MRNVYEAVEKKKKEFKESQNIIPLPGTITIKKGQIFPKLL